MKRGAGSFIKKADGTLEENLGDPVMKKRKGIREKKEKGTPPLNPPLVKEGTIAGGTKKRPADKQQAKAEIVAVMAQVIISGENLISGGRPNVEAVEEILGYQISEKERDNLMKEVISDVS